MVKAIPSLSIPKQRELVMLLFFWEEETARWMALGSEESELEQRLEERELSQVLRAELGCMLEAARVKKRLVPSERNAHLSREEQLPAYSERVS
jgi:hypothetical protein